MAESLSPDELFDCALVILQRVELLADYLARAEHEPARWTGSVKSAWQPLFNAIVNVGNALPSEPSSIADWVREIAKVARKFKDNVEKHGLSDVLFRFNNDGFARVACEWGRAAG